MMSQEFLEGRGLGPHPVVTSERMQEVRETFGQAGDCDKIFQNMLMGPAGAGCIPVDI